MKIKFIIITIYYHILRIHFMTNFNNFELYYTKNLIHVFNIITGYFFFTQIIFFMILRVTSSSKLYIYSSINYLSINYKIKKTFL